MITGPRPSSLVWILRTPSRGRLSPLVVNELGTKHGRERSLLLWRCSASHSSPLFTLYFFQLLSRLLVRCPRLKGRSQQRAELHRWVRRCFLLELASRALQRESCLLLIWIHAVVVWKKAARGGRQFRNSTRFGVGVCAQGRRSARAHSHTHTRTRTRHCAVSGDNSSCSSRAWAHCTRWESSRSAHGLGYTLSTLPPPPLPFSPLLFAIRRKGRTLPFWPHPALCRSFIEVYIYTVSLRPDSDGYLTDDIQDTNTRLLDSTNRGDTSHVHRLYILFVCLFVHVMLYKCTQVYKSVSAVF